MTDRRSFVWDLLTFPMALWAIARGVKQVAEAPEDPPLERQVDARFTAYRLGEPRDPMAIEYSLDGATWAPINLAPETLVAMGAHDAMEMAHMAATRAVLKRQLAGLPFPSGGRYLLRAMEYWPTRTVQLWFMRCRYAAVYSWDACAFSEEYVLAKGLPACWQELMGGEGPKYRTAKGTDPRRDDYSITFS